MVAKKRNNIARVKEMKISEQKAKIVLKSLRKMAANNRNNIARLKKIKAAKEKAKRVQKAKVICRCESDDIDIIGHFLENDQEKILYSCKCKKPKFRMAKYEFFVTKWPILINLYYESVYTHECKSKFCQGFFEKLSDPIASKSNKRENARRKACKKKEQPKG